VNPSPDPALPHHPDRPPADPTADPAPAGPTTRSPAGFTTEPSADSPVGPAPDNAGSTVGNLTGPTADGGYEPTNPGGPGGDPYSFTPEGYADDWPEPRPSRRPWRRTLLVAASTAVVVFILGGPLGVIWHWLAPGVPVLNAGPNGIVVNDPSPEEYVAADGWYTMLGLAFGLLVAIVAWLVLRRDRGPFLLLGVVLGTFGAGYLVAPWTGGLIGRSGYHHWQATAAQGATYLAPPQVHSVGPRLVSAFAAAIVLTLLAGWSNDPDLDAPGAHPGYGPNTTTPDAHPSYDPHTTAPDLHNADTAPTDRPTS
jgi:hypothetical protein